MSIWLIILTGRFNEALVFRPVLKTDLDFIFRWICRLFCFPVTSCIYKFSLTDFLSPCLKRAPIGHSIKLLSVSLSSWLEIIEQDELRLLDSSELSKNISLGTSACKYDDQASSPLLKSSMSSDIFWGSSLSTTRKLLLSSFWKVNFASSLMLAVQMLSVPQFLASFMVCFLAALDGFRTGVRRLETARFLRKFSLVRKVSVLMVMSVV